MSHSFTIRRAEARDADAVTEMWSELAAEHAGYDAQRWAWADDARERWREWFCTSVGLDNAVVLVAVDADHRPVGYLLAQVTDQPPVLAIRKKASIYDLAVRAPYRRRGLGRRLMEAAMAAAKVKGAGQVSLLVAAGNTGATAFYRKLGLRLTAHELYMAL